MVEIEVEMEVEIKVEIRVEIRVEIKVEDVLTYFPSCNFLFLSFF